MNISIVMPVFNEEKNIEDFVDKISMAFLNHDYHIYIIDDCSTDNTSKILAKIENQNKRVSTVRNGKNSGHGPTTYKALKIGLTSKAKHILAVDGDGQFKAEELEELYRSLESDKNLELVEGIRIRPDEPWYRQSVSLITRILVFLSCGSMPKDANTPCRIYKRETLEFLTKQIDPNSLIPNLEISKITRRDKLKFVEKKINFISKTGSTWNQTKVQIPSRKFIIFCFKASMSWLKK